MYLYSGRFFPLWRLLGLAPVRVNEKTAKITLSTPLVIYNIFIMFLLTVFASYPVYSELRGYVRVRMTTTTARVGSALDHLSLLLCCLVGIISNTVYCVGIGRLMNTVRSVDKSLNYDDSKSQYVKFTYCFLAYLTIHIFADMINWLHINPKSAQYIPSYLLHYVIFGIEFGYIDVVLHIKRRFESLNVALEEQLMESINQNVNPLSRKRDSTRKFNDSNRLKVSSEMYLYSGRFFPLWRLLGLAPVRVNEKTAKITLSTPLVIYNIFIMFLLTVFASYPVYSELRGYVRVRMTTTTARVGSALDHLSLLLCCLVGIISNTVYCVGIGRLMNTVRSVDKSLNYDDSKSQYVKFTYCFLAYLTIHIFADMINWLHINPKSAQYIPSYLLHYVIFGIEFGYIDVVLHIKRRFESLNVALEEQLMESINQNVNPLSRKRNAFTETKKGIVSFTHIHWILCDVVRQLNYCYGYQILVAMLSILIHIVITPYFFLLGLAYPSQNTDKNFVYLIIQGSWTVVHALQLITITWSCSTSTDKANETAPLISKYLLSNIGEDKQKEMESCVVQLLHHKAAFSACGLFEINLPIITAVTGAVTTYLVILIQFQNADTT